MDRMSFNVFSGQNYVDCTLIQFGWEQCRSLHSFGPATRSHYLFHYILSGNGTLYSTGKKGETTTYRLSAGQGFLICPEQVNYYIADEESPWAYSWVEFDGLKAPEFMALAGLSLDKPVYSSSDLNARQILEDEILYIARHGGESSLNMIGHLYLFLDALIRSSNHRMTLVGTRLKDFYAAEAIRFIEQNYQKNITVEDIASYCGLNRSYLGKVFKKVVSATPQDFLIRYRMAKACEYLETTNYTIGEISQRVGYPSQLHFSRAFKNIYGSSPRQWKQANGGKWEEWYP